MRKNVYTGEVFLPLRGEGDIRVRFTWGGIGEMRAKDGEEWEAKFRSALNGMDTERMAWYLAISTDKPESWWLEKSPPMLEAAEALNTALEISFIGAGGTPERPRTALQFLTRFWKGLKPGSDLEATPSSSGS